MFPILFSVGPFTIHTYGALLALGALLGIWTIHRQAKKTTDVNPDHAVNLAFWLLLVGLLGTRVFFVFLEPEGFIEKPWRFFALWEGGLVFYGGIAFAVPVGVFLVRRWKLPLLSYMDVVAPGLALAQGFGRLGCFSAGCCYGLPWDGACSVIFSDPHTQAPRNIPLHPAQLYSALELFALFGLLIWLSKRRRFAGQIFFTYGLIHGVSRLVIEQFRGDWRGETLVAGITVTGLLALLLALASAGALIYLNRRSKQT